jgi:uncharacterized membrane protein
MPRFISWLAVGVAAAFLVVATAAFPLPTIAWLAFSIGIGTLVVSAGIAYASRNQVASLVTALVTAAVGLWTIVASLVYSLSTVQNLAFAGALAIGGLALVGLTVHEFSVERVARAVQQDSAERESRLAAAA